MGLLFHRRLPQWVTSPPSDAEHNDALPLFTYWAPRDGHAQRARISRAALIIFSTFLAQYKLSSPGVAIYIDVIHDYRHSTYIDTRQSIRPSSRFRLAYFQGLT